MYECSLWTQSDDFKALISTDNVPRKSQKCNRYPSVSQPSTYNNRYNAKGEAESTLSQGNQLVSNIRKKHKNRRKQRQLSMKDRQNLSAELLKEYTEKKSSSPTYKRMMMGRARLPAWKQNSEVLNAISKNQVVLISGETGCGKTTQVPHLSRCKHERVTSN